MKQKIVLVMVLLSLVFAIGCSKKSDEETEKPITKENMAEELDRLEQQIAEDDAAE
ncbi:MAG: hypothetical protein KAJ07_13035 [Planctomycetes bacterium]|nr:hypothetical protein [Planctomycetota bacterium]MCK5566161.1 hypothetical protein [Planctomycetota bacterium]